MKFHRDISKNRNLRTNFSAYYCQYPERHIQPRFEYNYHNGVESVRGDYRFESHYDMNLLECTKLDTYNFFLSKTLFCILHFPHDNTNARPILPTFMFSSFVMHSKSKSKAIHWQGYCYHMPFLSRKISNCKYFRKYLHF